MFEKIFSVSYNSSNNCFCYLAPNALPNFKPGIYLKASYGENRTIYLSALANPTIVNKDVIELSSLYAQALNLNEGETVAIETVHDLPTITSLSVMPLTKNDYEIIETFADNIQSSLLDQISVINAEQTIIIWIGSNIYVTVYIDKVFPTSPGRIENLTEISIETPSNETKSKKDLTNQTPSSIHKNENDSCSTKFDESDFRDVLLIYRMVPLKDQKFVRNIADYLFPFNVFVKKDYVKKHWSLTSTKDEPIICKISLLSLNIVESRTIYVKLCCLEDYIFGFDDCLPTKHIYVDDLIFNSLSSHVCARISLERVRTTPFVKEIQISPVKSSQFNLEQFRLYLADHCTKTIVLNPNIPIEFNAQLKCSFKLDPSISFCVVDENFVKNCKYTIIEECTESKNTEIYNSINDYSMDHSNITEIVDKVLYNCIGNRVGWFENVLLIGKPGAGKSCTLQVIKEKLAHYPYYIHTEMIYCASLKGKTVDSLHKILMATASELILHQPSCLILDDLEILCDNVTDDNVNQNAVHFNRVSEMMQYYLNYIKGNKITVIASTKSTHRLNKLIYSTRGENLFKNVYSLKDLDKTDRTKLLIYFLKKFHINDIDFNELARKTEGFVIQDLFNLVQKTVFEAYKEEFENEVVIKPEHFESAIKTLNILSLQNVQLYSAGEKDFSYVGGLNDIKKLLLESLIWPTKYSSLFSKAPLRLQSGLLLYGPPGTGKTLLAGAAASHCGLRLISIKGPELLSKYIGASEQAVRDTFQKAQNARPCILFFDEFDSLAPRRGHDNTGVTDRVVNQLLTQLDGVESLTGVCVLAATSRPDLLDPALLRPGRLDRQVFCPLPDEESRFEILRILSKSLPLDKSVDLNKIAQVTEGYSGADLQSILCTAQMSTIDLLTESKDMELQSISELHLEAAIEKTRPSLSAAERAKYERIYKKFQGGGMEDFKSGSRATLA